MQIPLVEGGFLFGPHNGIFGFFLSFTTLRVTPFASFVQKLRRVLNFIIYYIIII